MSASPAPAAGPSSQPGATTRVDSSPLLPQAVMEYLQQHGFDKVLQTFEQELKGRALGGSGADGKDAEGDEDPAGVSSSGRKNSGSGREAIFRAPPPLPLEHMVKRNMPQASTMSASTVSDVVTPEFMAQAKYVIEQLQRRLESTAAANAEDDGAPGAVTGEVAGNATPFIDSSDRVEGYKRYRRWVDDALDLWKFELDTVSYPLFAHTYLDLIEFGFKNAAGKFFADHAEHYKHYHPSEVAQLSSVGAAHQILINPYCYRLRTEKYTISISRNAFALLAQWLSGAGLDEEWEVGLHGVPGRAKEAIRSIINSRLDVRVSPSSTPLDKITIASSTGLITSLFPKGVSPEKLVAANPLKLGPPPMHEKLREEVIRIIRDEEDSIAAANGSRTAISSNSTLTIGTNGDSSAPNGHGRVNGHDADGDISMSEPTTMSNEERSGSVPPSIVLPPSTIPPRSPLRKEIKLEENNERTSDLISPEPNETLPPQPNFYKLIDIKREVEAIRDKRKLVRLGPKSTDDNLEHPPSSMTLPSVVAFTMFDSGENVTSIEFSPDSSLIAAGSAESCVRLWSLKNESLKAKKLDPMTGSVIEDEGLAMRKLIGHSGPVYSLSFDPVSGSAGPPHSLLSSSQDGTIRLWSLDTYSNLVIYRGHGREPVWDVKWGPMGVYFASSSRDRTARLWSSDRVAPLRMYTGHLSDVNCVQFHPNSLYLATGSSDNSCRLWDVQRGACVRLFLGHTDAVTTMAISPDGRTLASAGQDCSIYLWDLGSSRPIKKMTGHTAPIQSLSFSAESSVLVSGGLDSTVRCWDVKSAGGMRTPSSVAAANGGAILTAGGGGKSGAGGGTTGAMLDVADANRRISVNQIDMTQGAEGGTLPMVPEELGWELGQTSDLLATFQTKRTPIIKTHYTPRNLCMVAGSFVPPSTRA